MGEIDGDIVYDRRLWHPNAEIPPEIKVKMDQYVRLSPIHALPLSAFPNFIFKCLTQLPYHTYSHTPWRQLPRTSW